jgi:hypothetical protein
MTAHVDPLELPPLSALELLNRWAAIHGPDPRTEAGNRSRGTLGLYRLPTCHRHHEAGRRTAASTRRKGNPDGRPQDTGVTTAWWANAPPAPPSA